MNNPNQERLPDIIKTAKLDASIQSVWDAVATSSGIASWFMPNDFEPIIGHEFTLQTDFGPTPCKVTEVNSPNRLSFDWDTFGWHVTFDLIEIDGETELTVTHSGWGAPDEIIPRTQQPNALIHNIMNNGWEPNINEKLRKVVEGK